MAFSLMIRFLNQVPSILIKEHVLLIRTRFFILYRFIIVVHMVYEPYRLDTFKYHQRKTEEYVIAWGKVQLLGIKLKSVQESRPVPRGPIPSLTYAGLWVGELEV
jgi:hypothetical protein